MSLLQRMCGGLKKDLETMKALTLRQKIGFVLDYWRGYLFLALCLLLLFFYLGDLIYQSRQVIDLQGFFVNDSKNLFPAGELAEEFSAYLGTARGHRIAFEDSLYVDLDSDSEYSAASQSKIVAYTAARQLDFLVAPAELAEYYASSIPTRDLEELLPEDLLAALAGDLCYLPDSSGQNKACCLSLRNSRYFQGADEGTEEYRLLVLDSTKRAEAVTAFLRFSYGLPPVLP